MKPDPNRLWPDVFFYDRDLRDCTVYAWLLFGDDSRDVASAMFLLSPAEILEWQGWPYLEPNL
jgi:hypothetical protein